ncbi:MAG: acyl-CoA desaturase, partial [Pseudomonadota bacterium]|nr:acyl-CoA desaturase [Pseudomonadota bacterium]
MRDRLPPLPNSLLAHRVAAEHIESVCAGDVRYDPIKSIWIVAMAGGAAVGGLATFTWAAFAIFILSTGCVLLFGHSLGSHRKL